jgi:hypothetical protein
MATVQVTFKRAMDGGPIESAGFSSNQTITSSASSQQTTASASNSDIMVIETDGNIRFKTGSNPTAVADDTCELVQAGRYQFSVSPGDKCAIIDA